MAKRVRFVLNRPNVKSQIHYGAGMNRLLSGVASSMESEDVDTEVQRSSDAKNQGRLRVRAWGKPDDASAALGRARA
ncbi:MAG: hypothetical protein WC054_02725 [Candidatus Nanopelagicales bacterium]